MTEEAAKYITEADFQAAVIDLAEAQGWKVAHFHDSRRWVPTHFGGGKWVGDAQAKGWPDLVLVRGEAGPFSWSSSATAGRDSPASNWIGATRYSTPA